MGLIFTKFLGGKKKKKRLEEVNNGFTNSQIALNSPWQVKKLSHNKLEDLAHIYVMSCT